MEDEGTSPVDIPIRLMFRLKFTAALGENERQTSKLQGDLASYLTYGSEQFQIRRYHAVVKTLLMSQIALLQGRI